VEDRNKGVVDGGGGHGDPHDFDGFRVFDAEREGLAFRRKSEESREKMWVYRFWLLPFGFWIYGGGLQALSLISPFLIN
ncbi:MAG TPA: hypothetical protein PLI59_22230, partial [Candidatus Obscuribacter sp.]|nr:hypothetical protein [Candidatus Obscuribacter sp.]